MKDSIEEKSYTPGLRTRRNRERKIWSNNS